MSAAWFVVRNFVLDVRNRRPVNVVFRVWKGRDNGRGVFALFPEEPADIAGRYCDSFGEHGWSGADYDACIRASRPATLAEWRGLVHHLQTIMGFNLVRVNCAPRWSNVSRRLKARRLQESA
jgi:hypothetical protein